MEKMENPDAFPSEHPPPPKVEKNPTTTTSSRLLPESTGPGIDGAYFEIFRALFIVSVPLLVLSCALLGLIYHYRLPPASYGSGTLQYPTSTNDASTYYVNFSATRLTTISSWMSTIAPYIPGFLMTLLSFRVASTLRKKSESADLRQLPTPYQLSLLLGLDSAGFGSLWHWLKYHHRNRRTQDVPAAKLPLQLLIIAMLFSHAIWALDTWFHVATNAVLITQIVPSPKSLNSYGRVISPSCLNVEPDPDNSPSASCVVFINSGSGASTLTGLGGAIETLSNVSTVNQVATGFFNNRSYSYLAPSNPQTNLDYRASTVALNTECQPFSKQCSLRAAYGQSTVYNCSQAMSGFSPSDTINLTMFSDSGLTTLAWKPANPFYLGIVTDFVDINFAANVAAESDSDVVMAPDCCYTIVTKCEVTVYNFTYSLLNGMLTSVETTPSDANITSLMIGPLMNSVYGQPMLIQGSLLASLSNTTGQFVNSLGNLFNNVALSFSTGGFTEQLNLEEQTRNGIVVTRVPKAPLFTLIVVNLLFVVYGIIVFVIALLSHPRETRDVQARLSVTGLVANLFEGERAGKHVSKLEDLFHEREDNGEKIRVAITRTDRNGWAFKSLTEREIQ